MASHQCYRLARRVESDCVRDGGRQDQPNWRERCRRFHWQAAGRDGKEDFKLSAEEKADLNAHALTIQMDEIDAILTVAIFGSSADPRTTAAALMFHCIKQRHSSS